MEAMNNSSSPHSFSKAAPSYDTHAYLQQKIANELIARLKTRYPEQPRGRILDLGCGTGALWRALQESPEEFTGIDASHEMLRLHPRSATIKTVHTHFNDPALYERPHDLIISSSALQWSENLPLSLDLIASSTAQVALALFANQTLKELHALLGTQSPLPASSLIKTLLLGRFYGEITHQTHTLGFDSSKALLEYLQGSGISGHHGASFSQRKKLLSSPPKTLSFEVIFFVGQPKPLEKRESL